jgi:hypothetical protein
MLVAHLISGNNDATSCGGYLRSLWNSAHADLGTLPSLNGSTTFYATSYIYIVVPLKYETSIGVYMLLVYKDIKLGQYFTRNNSLRKGCLK